MEKRKRTINWSRTSLIIVHLALGLFNLAVFYFYCNAYSFVMAFQRVENGVTVWTMANFTYFFEQMADSSSILVEAFRNTGIWFLVALSQAFIGLFTSYFLYKKIWGYKFFRVVFFIPGLISAVVISNMITRMLGTQGIIAKLVQKIDKLEYVPELLVDSRYSLKTLIFKSYLFGIAGGMLIWCGTMSRIPDSVIESAKLDGVGCFKEFTMIVIPMILPAVAISLCQTLSSFFSCNGGEFLYTKGEFGTMTFSTWQYLQIYNTSVISNSHNIASASGWLITLIMVPVVLITRYLSRKAGEVEY